MTDLSLEYNDWEACSVDIIFIGKNGSRITGNSITSFNIPLKFEFVWYGGESRHAIVQSKDSYYYKNKESLFVPLTYNGHDVTIIYIGWDLQEGKTLPAYNEDGIFINDTSLETLIVPCAPISKVDYHGNGGDIIPTNIKTLIFTEGTTEIQSEDFLNWSSLTSLVIPESVERIGSKAFKGCTGLTSVVIPEEVEKIGASAFEGCTSLTSIVIPESVDEIGEDAFKGCSNLSNISIKGIPTIYSSAFDGTAVGNWYDGAFYVDNCLIKAKTSIGTCAIREGTTVIAVNAFNKCKSLKSIEIPSSIKHVGYSAFSDVGSISKVNFLGTIDEWAQIQFGNEQSSPLNNYWEDGGGLYINNNLVTDVILTTATKIETAAFYHCNLTSIVILDSVETIGESAFERCGKLSSVVMSKSVKWIGSDAFAGCTGLTSVVIPEGVERIGSDAFAGCTGLTSIEIPSSVIYIGSYAFKECKKLSNISIKGAPEIDYNVFDDTAYYATASNWQDGILYIDNCLIEADSAIEGCIIKDGVGIPNLHPLKNNGVF